MPIKTIGTYELKYLQILAEDGEADASLASGISEELARRFYEAMVLARTFNSRALSLQREGRIGTYASILGQEASQVGTALAFGESDWIYPTFRESGVFIALGYPPHLLFRYWAGDERGMKAPEGLNIFPMSVPVGTQIPHATGTAIAMKLAGDSSASAVYFGDGGSSRGDFHEAMNIAGVFRAPAVFLCQNNQYAISVPRSRQSAGTTIAERAHSYGCEGLQVDGNDVFAVYRATADALERARSGEGPTLIECFTYRLDDHTTADDASRYRSAEEVAEWKKKDPLLRLRRYMEKKGIWDEGLEKKIESDATGKIDAAIKEAEAMEDPAPGDIIRCTYSELLPRQKKELKDLGWE